MNMHESQPTVQTDFANTSNLNIPLRPPHPHAGVTPEILAPLISSLSADALGEIHKVLCDRTPEPIMIASVAGRVQRAGDIGLQAAQREVRLTLLSLYEGICVVINRSGQSPHEILRCWQEHVLPMIEQVSKFSKAGENQVTSAIKRFQGSINGLKETIAPGTDPESTDESEESDGKLRLSEMLDKVVSFATDNTKLQGRHERDLLNSLRYEPFSQYEQLRLNELAITMKQRGFEIIMDKRDPVASVGEDDTRLLAQIVGSRMKDWAREIGETLAADLLDPITSLTMPDQDALLGCLEAIREARTVTLEVDGTEALKFSLTLPAGLPLTQQSADQRIEELLAPLAGFEQALGFTHRVDLEKISGGVRLIVTLALPYSERSTFEPENFAIREMALNRLTRPNPFGRMSALGNMTSEGDEMFSMVEESVEEPQASSYSILAPGDLSITVSRSLIEEKSCQETLDLMRMVCQIAKFQPDIRKCYLNVPKDRMPEMAAKMIGDKVLVRLDNAPAEVPSDLDATREAIEQQRRAVKISNGMQTVMEIMETSARGSIDGGIQLSEIGTILERAEQLPRWIRCAQMRLKLFTLKDEPFDALVGELTRVKESRNADKLYLVEMPPHLSDPGSKNTLKYIVYSDTEVPLQEITLDSVSSAIRVKQFDSALFEELRDRIASTLNGHGILTPQRTRDIDALLLGADVDLTAPLIEELTGISNSWAGRKIPLIRISQVLDEYHFDDAFVMSRAGNTLRCLHPSEQPTPPVYERR